MKKTFLLALAVMFLLPQAGFVTGAHHGFSNKDDEFSDVKNPSLMHMHRKEFIAAGIAQGMAANGGLRDHTPELFAKEVMRYTNALMVELDKEDK